MSHHNTGITREEWRDRAARMRNAVLSTLKKSPLTATQLAAKISADADSLRHLLPKMIKEDAIHREAVTNPCGGRMFLYHYGKGISTEHIGQIVGIPPACEVLTHFFGRVTA